LRKNGAFTSSLDRFLNSFNEWPLVDDEVFKVKNKDGLMR